MDEKLGIKFKPFLSFTTLRIFALAIFGLGHLALAVYILAMTTVVPIESVDSGNANNIIEMIIAFFSQNNIREIPSEFKNYIGLWPKVKAIYSLTRLVPLLMVIGLFSRLIQRRESITIIFVEYFIMSFLFYVGELFFYYTILKPFVTSFVETRELTSEISYTIYMVVKSIFETYSNINIFVDMLVAFFFFKFFMLDPRSKFFSNHKTIYRLIAWLTILYPIVSLILITLERSGRIFLPFYIVAGLSARGIYVYIIFISLCIYYKIRRWYVYSHKTIMMPSTNKNQEVFYFNIFLISILVLVSSISFILGKIINTGYFNFGLASKYYYISPLIFFYNHTIKARFKYINILYVFYYFVLTSVLYTIYKTVFDYALNIIKIIIKAFKQ